MAGGRRSFAGGLVWAIWLAAAVGCGGDSSRLAADASAVDAGSTRGGPGGARSSASLHDAGGAAAGASGAREQPKDAGATEPAKDASAASDLDGSDETSLPVQQAVTLRFRALLGGRDFACGQSYPDQGSSKTEVTPQDLRMYVQDVRLLRADGSDVPLSIDERAPWQSKDVVLLDFEDGTGECFGDSATNRVIEGHVPPGEYRGVRFAVGVPDALNHGKPETLPAPLQEPGMSWNWLLGFRFLKAELGAVGSDNGTDAGVGRGVFHLGSVACAGNPSAGTIKCGKPNRNAVTLQGFDPAKNVIALDLSALFQTLDLSRDSECHSADAPCGPMFRALGIDYATGAPSDTQTVFRVE